MNSVDDLIQEFVKGDDGQLNVCVGIRCILQIYVLLADLNPESLSTVDNASKIKIIDAAMTWLNTHASGMNNTRLEYCREWE